MTTSIDTSLKTVAWILAGSAIALALAACGERAERQAPVATSNEVAAVSTPKPQYPLELACAGVGGQVTLALTVGIEGTPTEVQLVQSSGNEALDRAATEGVQDWQFKPASRGGQRHPTTIRVPVDFNVPQPRPDECFALDAKR